MVNTDCPVETWDSSGDEREDGDWIIDDDNIGEDGGEAVDIVCGEVLSWGDGDGIVDCGGAEAVVSDDGCLNDE